MFLDLSNELIFKSVYVCVCLGGGGGEWSYVVLIS